MKCVFSEDGTISSTPFLSYIKKYIQENIIPSAGEIIAMDSAIKHTIALFTDKKDRLRLLFKRIF